MASDFEDNKYDTHATTIYFVRLAQDAKAFKRNDEGEDVVLTFVDDSRVKGTEKLWVDARVIKFQSDRARKHRKGDLVQIEGKLRFKLQKDGTMRGKIYDAKVNSYEKLADREVAGTETSAPVFE